jgi:hypothetical protein
VERPQQPAYQLEEVPPSQGLLEEWMALEALVSLSRVNS